MQQHKLPVETAPAAADAWYRQPVLWLGLVIFAASLAGCIWTIVLGSRHADLPLEMSERPHTLLDMPMHPAGKSSRKPEDAKGAQPPSYDAAGAPAQHP
jgi:hypothetical protein